MNLDGSHVTGNAAPGQPVIAVSASSFGNPFLYPTEFVHVSTYVLHYNWGRYAWEGRVYVYDVSSLLVPGQYLITDVPALNVISGHNDFAHLGWQLLLADINNDGNDEIITSLVRRHATNRVNV